MHLHLATGMLLRGHIDWIYNRVRRDIPKPLLTFAYPDAAATIPVHLEGPQPVRLLVDSGAFTAFTQGQVLRPEAYAGWALELERRWGPHLRALHFFSLDVIGDQDASWRNHTHLEQLGLQPIPIVTFGADLRHLERALGYPYLALGGLVPWAKRRSVLQAVARSVLRPDWARMRAHGAHAAGAPARDQPGLGAGALPLLQRGQLDMGERHALRTDLGSRTPHPRAQAPHPGRAAHHVRGAAARGDPLQRDGAPRDRALGAARSDL